MGFRDMTNAISVLETRKYWADPVKAFAVKFQDDMKKVDIEELIREKTDKFEVENRERLSMFETEADATFNTLSKILEWLRFRKTAGEDPKERSIYENEKEKKRKLLADLIWARLERNKQSSAPPKEIA